jgi:hypothetical protein
MDGRQHIRRHLTGPETPGDGAFGRVLDGEMPVDLPVMQAANFEFVIDPNTARALAIE